MLKQKYRASHPRMIEVDIFPFDNYARNEFFFLCRLPILRYETRVSQIHK